MHESSHYRQLSEADRTVTSARQARNDDHLKFERDKHWDQRRRAMRSERMRAYSLWERKSQSHHSLIIFSDHHHVFYNIFDQCWVSLLCARNENEIKNLSEKKKFKKIRFERTWSFWDHSTKRLDCFEVCTDHSTIQTRQSDCKAETNDQTKRMWNDYKWQLWLKKSFLRFKTRIDQKNRLRRFEVETMIIFLLFYRVQITWKIIIAYFSHAFTKERDDVWIKHTNK
jgi:hypothetical protein